MVSRPYDQCGRSSLADAILVFTRRPERDFNLTNCLSEVKEVRVKPAVVLRAGENLSFGR